MSPHSRAPSLDAPTIAFDSQPTCTVDARLLARAFEASTSSTLRPIALPTRETATSTLARRRPSRSAAWLTVAGLVLGVVAGHLVREGRSYAATLASVTADAHGETPMRPRDARSVVILGARAPEGVRTKEVAAPKAKNAPRVKPSGRVPSPPSAKAVSPLDALFVDYEPAFRVPQ